MKPIDERKALFYELFNQGRIQARRFFDVAIPNFQELEELTRSMYEGGTGLDLQAAEQLMQDQPMSQYLLSMNRLQAVSIDMGKNLLIVITEFLTPAISSLTDAWFNLDEQQRQIIVRLGTLASGFAIVSGTLLSLVGVLILSTALATKFPLLLTGMAAGVLTFGSRIRDGLPVILENWKYFGERFNTIWEQTLSDLSTGSFDFVDDWVSLIYTMRSKMEGSFQETALDRILA